MKLQQTGMFDNDTIIKMGKMAGANIIIFGTVSELKNNIDINLKIMGVEKGIVKGGVSHTIAKTSQIASLVGAITLSEKEKEKDLELERQRVLADIEIEKQKRLKAIEKEEQEMRDNLVGLEKKLRNESEVIKKYEAKKEALSQKQAYIEKLQAEIDSLNSAAEQNVRLGMTLEQVNKILNWKLSQDSTFHNEYHAGRYNFIFQGGVLTDVWHSTYRHSSVSWIE